MSVHAWVALLIFVPFGLVILWMPFSFARGQRECNRRNAENRQRWDYWKALTREDRAWLIANGATEPSLTYWEMR